jgi:hypothetical protein
MKNFGGNFSAVEYGNSTKMRKVFPIFIPPRGGFRARKKLYKLEPPITLASTTGCGWLTPETQYIVV